MLLSTCSAGIAATMTCVNQALAQTSSYCSCIPDYVFAMKMYTGQDITPFFCERESSMIFNL